MPTTLLGSVGYVLQAVLPGTAQTVAFTTTTQSAALGANTVHVRLIATAACYVAFGANPTATSANMMLPPNVAEYFIVTPATKIAALQVSSGGNINITELA